MAVAQERSPCAVFGLFPCLGRRSAWGVAAALQELRPGAASAGVFGCQIRVRLVVLKEPTPDPAAASSGVFFLLLRGRCEIWGGRQAAAARFPISLAAAAGGGRCSPRPSIGGTLGEENWMDGPRKMELVIEASDRNGRMGHRADGPGRLLWLGWAVTLFFYVFIRK